MVSPWTASKGDYRQEKEMRKWSEWAGKERCSEEKGTGVNTEMITKVNRLPTSHFQSVSYVTSMRARLWSVPSIDWVL